MTKMNILNGLCSLFLTSTLLNFADAEGEPPLPPPCLESPPANQLFYSPGFPEQNNGIAKCNYSFEAEPGQKVLLTFLHVKINGGYRCNSAHISMYFPNGTLEKKICGDTSEKSQFLSEDSQLGFKYETRRYSSSRGWVAKWRSVPADYIINSEEGKESFFLPHPATFLRAQEEEVCLEVEGFEGEVEFTMQFYSFNDRTSFYAEPTDVDAIKLTDFSQAKPDAEFKQKGGAEGSKVCIAVNLPFTPDNVEPAILKITIKDDGSFLEEIFREVRIIKPETVTKLQTDKGKYKGGDTVRFRILGLDYNLKALNETFSTLKVVDPSYRTIQLWKDVSLEAGLIQREFKLQDEPLLGDWRVELHSGDTLKLTANFEVSEYVLPKFEVKIEPPAVVLQDAEYTEWKVCGKYTHGAPVKGEILAQFSANRNYNGYGRFRPGQTKYVNYTLTVPEDQDCVQVPLSKSDLAELQDIKNGEQASNINFNVEFTEEGTGTIESAVGSSVSVVNKEFLISFGSSSSQFILGGFPYTAEIKVSNHDGTPRVNERLVVCSRLFRDIEDVRTVFNSYWSFTEDDFISQIISIQNLTYRNSCQEVRTDEGGYVRYYLSLGKLPKDVKKLSVKVTAADVQIAEGSSMAVPTERHDVTLEQTEGSLSLSINNKQGSKLNCTEFNTFTVYVAGNKGIERELKHYVISGGEVLCVGSQTIALQGDDDRSDLLDGRTELNIEGLTENPESIIKKAEIEVEAQSHKAFPTVKIVTYMTDGNETLTDSHEMGVNFCLENPVEVSLSTSETSPGSTVVLNLQTNKGSLCGLSMVDKSVELLGNPNKVSKKVIGDIRETMKSQRMNYYSSQNWELRNKCPVLAKFLDEFSNAGMSVISNLPSFTACQTLEVYSGDEVEEPEYVNYGYSEEERIETGQDYDGENDAQGVRYAAQSMEMSADFSANDGLAMRVGGAEPDAPPIQPVVAPVRTEFPETWLFSLEEVNLEDGSLNKELIVPDTLTSWSVDALCMNPSSGLGVSDTKTILVSQDFFADLRLPFAVKRGEVFPLNISVFNNLETDLPLVLTIQSENVKPNTEQFKLCLSGRSNELISVPTKADKVGDIDVLVSATIENHEGCSPVEQGLGFSDRLKKPLNVKPEGIPVEKAQSEFKCLDNSVDKVVMSRLEVPETIVEGSDRAWIHISGDILAPALQNIGNLVNMPTGCGEQNMVGLVPNIYLLQYLANNPQSDPKLEARAVTYMESGYNKQLKYRHSTGAYSIWGGNNEKAGSTWLTAFVVKAFSQASEFISIDEPGLLHSVNWLLDSQLENGCFEKRGYVYSSSLQGGNSDSSLSAFVVSALIEFAAKFKFENADKLSNAVKCVVDRRNDTDLYSLSLATYAGNLLKYKLNCPSSLLAKNGLVMNEELSEEISNMTEFLVAQANRTQPGAVFWDQRSEEQQNSWYYYSRSTAIEMTAYNVMSLTLSDRLDEVVDSVKWLARQRNSQGGFASTQDTVVALQALSVYGSKIGKYEQNLKIKMNTENLELNSDNSQVLQTFKIGELPADVELDLEGSGCILVQTVLRYNIPEAKEAPSFSLKVTNADNKLSICTAYIGQRESTDMVVLEVEMLTGYKAVNPDILLNEIDSGVERVEVDEKENKIVLYFDEIPKQDKCVDLTIEEEMKIQERKPARVTVYDYYNTEERHEITYTI